MISSRKSKSGMASIWMDLFNVLDTQQEQSVTFNLIITNLKLFGKK